jgi:hypothetical protein
MAKQQTFVTIERGSWLTRTTRNLAHPMAGRKVRKLMEVVGKELGRPITVEVAGWQSPQYSLVIGGVQVTPFWPWEGIAIYIQGLLVGHQLRQPEEDVAFNDGVAYAQAQDAEQAQESYLRAAVVPEVIDAFEEGQAEVSEVFGRGQDS